MKLELLQTEKGENCLKMQSADVFSLQILPAKRIYGVLKYGSVFT